ncbi:MAG: right-handed parallel beta-helix repeat-containing protein [Anaerolineae bacterium]
MMRITLVLLVALAMALPTPITTALLEEPVTLTESGWSDPSVGVWDASTRTAALTMDLAGGILVASDGITLDGAGHTLSLSGDAEGIRIAGRSAITIRNLLLSGGATGVAVHDSSGVTVTAVSVTGATEQGVLLVSSRDCALLGNAVRASGTGIQVEGSAGVRIAENTLEANALYGLWLNESSMCDLTGNSMLGNRYGFYLQGLEDPYWDHQITSDNLIDGRPILYRVGDSDLTFDASTNPAAVYLVHCRRVTIRNLRLSATGTGVLLYDTHASEITDVSTTSTITGIGLYRSHGNTITDGSTYTSTLGVVLWGSDGNTLQGHDTRFNWAGINMVNAHGNVVRRNQVAENDRGVRMYNSSGNALYENTITHNRAFGLHLDATFANQFFRNNLIENVVQVHTAGGDDSFSQPLPTGGNHWSDWNAPDADGNGLVDAPYMTGGAPDAYPWVESGGWLQQDLPIRLWLPAIVRGDGLTAAR